MDGAHRKIELQSPEDLTFLIDNVRRAATEHVTAAFPPVDGQDDAEEDGLRVRIEKLVNDYISHTFTLAAPNLSINGFDLDPTTFPTVYLPPSSPDAANNNISPDTRRRQQQEPEVQYEPFDGRKRARVEDLAREEEDLMRDIAALKRKVPSAAARAYADGFWDAVRRDEEALELELARGRATAGPPQQGADGDDGDGGDEEEEDDEGDDQGDGVDGEEKGGKGKQKTEAVGEKKKKVKTKKRKAALMLDGVGPLERQADVERGYGGLVETLSRMKREMPATVAKMERARVAGQYVVTER